MSPATSADPSLFIHVAVPTPLRQLFHYLPPESIATPVIGARVVVPFGGGTLVGVVVGNSRESDVPANKLRRIHQVLDDEAIIPEAIQSLLTWASGYYHYSIGEVFNSSLPALLRKGESTRQSSRRILLTDDQSNPQVRGPKQLEILSHLKVCPEGLTQDQFRKLGFSVSALKSLVQKTWIHWVDTDVAPGNWDSADPSNPSDLRLNPDQQKIIDEADDSRPCLLYGVTGSGKTEIYFQLIDRVLRQGKQAIVLVPEIGLTPQTTSRFLERFKVPVEVMHSGLNDRERLSAWNNMRTNSSAILVGTRSAIFTPLLKPGLIVVDEEHDSSFKQNDGFRYSARDLAIMRGQLEDVAVILGSATPSLESYYNAKRNRYQLCYLGERAGSAAMPKYQIVDVSSRELTDGLSHPLINSVKNHLDRGNQVLIFLNRRGYAPVLFCKSCRWIAKCRYCDASTTYHHYNRKVICHHCGTQTPAPVSCPDCKSSSLLPLGAGTERTETALQQRFPGQRIIRIDADTTRRKLAMQSILKDIQETGPAILVGTQLLAKGHHFPNVTLVAILDMDSAFFSSDYKAIERMGQLILQVGGRAGREKKAGTVMLQTRFPDHPLLHVLIKEGYQTFAERLLEERQKFQLPPVTFQAILRAEATDKNLALSFLSEVKKEIARSEKPGSEKLESERLEGASVLGPVPSLMEKKANRFRAQLLFMSSRRKTLHPYLKICVRICEKSKMARKLRWSLDVDPVDLS